MLLQTTTHQNIQTTPSVKNVFLRFAPTTNNHQFQLTMLHHELQSLLVSEKSFMSEISMAEIGNIKILVLSVLLISKTEYIYNWSVPNLAGRVRFPFFLLFFSVITEDLIKLLPFSDLFSRHIIFVTAFVILCSEHVDAHRFL